MFVLMIVIRKTRRKFGYTTDQESTLRSVSVMYNTILEVSVFYLNILQYVDSV